MIIENFLQEADLQIINEDLFTKLQQTNWIETNSYFQNMESIYNVGHSGVKEKVEYPKDYGYVAWNPVSQNVFNILKKALTKIDDRCRTNTFKAFYQIFDINSGCSFHKDRHFFSATIYLNKIWNRNWGGYYIFENNSKLEVFVPQYNSCIFRDFEHDVEHCVSSVNKLAEERRYTIQIFGKF